MPSLILFKRRWRIGSDDFVFPGCFEAIIRLVWIILTSILFYEHIHDYFRKNSEDSKVCSKGEFFIRVFLIGVIIILSLSFILAVALIIHSAKGTIMYTSPRQHVRKILLLKVILGIAEVIWNVIGTVWLFSKKVVCEKDSALWLLLEALVVFTWVALPLLIITAVLLFEPMMRPAREESRHRASSFLDRTNSGIGSHYIQLWERRCRFMCCTFSKDEDSAEAFRNVADVLASVFEDSSLVASDIVAALVLLRVRTKIEETQQQNLIPNSNGDRSPGVRSVGSVQFSGPAPDWMNLKNAHHFMKFALGSYGWPWFVYGSIIRKAWSLRSYLKCFSCCRKESIVMGGDNCCQCNLAALRKVTGLSEENIIYVTFINRIYQTPFFVAIDDETENVIVGIRGTLSLQDAITDLDAQSTILSYEGLPNDSRAHKGIVNVAEFVKSKLDESNAIEEALRKRQKYGLVITGHSLGAGAAVILACMLRPQYPELKCFAFSSPGGLCSIEMYKATQEFVMSVVIADDLVPRLSIASINDLHRKIKTVLYSCRTPKYRVLAKGCWYMLFGIPKSSLQFEQNESAAGSEDQLINSEQAPAYLSVLPDEDSIQDIRLMFSEVPRPTKKHLETLLFPPGRILHLTPKPGCEKETSWDSNWVGNTDFQNILITPNMLRHHLPPTVIKALETAYNESLVLSENSIP